MYNWWTLSQKRNIKCNKTSHFRSFWDIFSERPSLCIFYKKDTFLQLSPRISTLEKSDTLNKSYKDISIAQSLIPESIYSWAGFDNFEFLAIYIIIKILLDFQCDRIIEPLPWIELIVPIIHRIYYVPEKTFPSFQISCQKWSSF